MKKYLISYFINGTKVSSETRELKCMTEHTLSFIRDELEEKHKAGIFIIAFSKFD